MRVNANTEEVKCPSCSEKVTVEAGNQEMREVALMAHFKRSPACRRR